MFTLLGLIQIKIRSFKWFIENFRVHNILVGDLVFDSYVRNYNHYQNPKTDTRFLIILFQAIFRTKRITKLFNERNIKFTLIPTSAYISNGAIAARVALENKIRVIEPYLYGSREITKQTVKNGYHYEKVKNFKNIQKVKNKSANKFLR